jgi:BirA family transcriptional regulator, biotin operon repressor / biotin---[acetyl-CoA-carboxylase] ligase
VLQRSKAKAYGVQWLTYDVKMNPDVSSAASAQIMLMQLQAHAAPMSLSALGSALCMQDAAVLALIRALQRDGLALHVDHISKQVSLLQPLDLLDEKKVLAALREETGTWLTALELAWSVDSTNSVLLEREIPLHGAVALLAEQQTGGRGRRGKTWVSPLASNLYLSIARRFQTDIRQLGGLSVVVGIAACEALHALGYPQIRLKWPNDLLVVRTTGLHKLAGILVESNMPATHPGVVIGLGVNLRINHVQASAIDQPWTALAALPGAMPSRNTLAATLLAHLLPAIQLFDQHGLQPFLQRYAALDVLCGKRLDIQQHGRVWSGLAMGIHHDGALQIQDDAGEMRLLHAGEVSVRAAS